MQGSTAYRAELEHSFGDINDENRRTKKIGWMDWMDYDMEELVEEKRKDAQQTVLDSLPEKYKVPHKVFHNLLCTSLQTPLFLIMYTSLNISPLKLTFAE
jgi:hypothetical protein